MAGFFLPLSGGIDSASVACLVGSMCGMVAGECAKGNAVVREDVRRLLGRTEGEELPSTGKELAQ